MLDNLNKLERVEDNVTPFKVYTGFANMEIIAVNPTLKELNDLGINFKKEPNYFTRDNDFMITFFLKHPTKDFTVSYRIVVNDNEVVSRNGDKKKILNKFGQSTWVNDSQFKEIKAGNSHLAWYLSDGVKIAKKGEEELISLIRLYKNFGKVDNTTSENIATELTAEDWTKICKGDTRIIKALDSLFKDKKEDGSLFTIAALFGARTTDTGSIVQDVYSDLLKSWQIKDLKHSALEKFVERVTESQAAGAFPNTNFELYDLTLKEYNPAVAPKPTDEASLNFDLNMPNISLDLDDDSDDLI